MKRSVLIYLNLQMFDVLLTLIGITYLGLSEGNPLVDHLGFYGLLAYKVVGFSSSAWLMQIKNLKWVNYVAIGVASVPVVWNTLIIGGVI